ncbi:MAG: MBL fold metallo-hydrolase [Candidatus Coproplasma sp.]
MNITFLGTAASEGVPAMFCSCKHCQEIKRRGVKEFRTRTQVLVDGDLSIDFPSESYVHSLKYGVDLSALKYLIVTHSHMDHFYAHDFILRGYKYAVLKEDLLSIYGNGEVAQVFEECTKRELKEEVVPHVKMNVINPYQSLDVGDYRILSLPAIHATAEEALLYYVEKGGKGYLHLYDTGELSDEAIEFLAENNAKANLVAFDCTFLDAPYEKGRRHMCIEGDIRLANRLERAGVIDNNTVKVITHFSHNSNPVKERLDEIERRYGVIAAYDGLSIDI